MLQEICKKRGAKRRRKEKGKESMMRKEDPKKTGKKRVLTRRGTKDNVGFRPAVFVRMQGRMVGGGLLPDC